MTSLIALLACVPGKPDAPGVSASDTAPDTAPPCEVGIEVGQCAPDFSLPDASGGTFTLSEQRGKVALVDISALW